MARKLSDQEMALWVHRIFQHEDTKWQYESEGELAEPPAAQSLSFMTRLFSSPETHLASYSDRQINQGFWFIIQSLTSPYIMAIFSPQESWNDRKDCIHSISSLFRKLFHPRCRRRMSSLDYDGALDLSPLNSICYMFWDLMPGVGPNGKPIDPKVDAAFLEVIEKILEMENIACQESALHGLGHMHPHHPTLVAGMIDRYLALNPWLKDDLRQYALAAREGMVQ